MAFVVGCFLAFALIRNAEDQPLQSNIRTGSSLTPTFPTPHGCQAPVCMPSGFTSSHGYAVGILLAGIPENTVVWTTNRDKTVVSNNATLRLTVDWISLQSTQGASSVASSYSVCFLCFNADSGISTNQGKLYLMRIDVDGIFRLYSHSLEQNGSWLVEWSSSNDKCDPLGLWRINSYCVTMDQEAECKCLPGFNPVTPGKSDFCCGKEFTKKDCSKACSEDCNCEAAVFVDGSCRKQRLPLRYGRRMLTDSKTAFIKVGMSKPPPTENIFQKWKQEKGRVGTLIGVSFGCLWVHLLVISVIVCGNMNVLGI
ncbi:hypothetical protein M0R45_005419 [Rubus argutus]|uniref:S-locus glycoprotein domain-containing protein n=1 Tax=Rubus argutus TaxID=59490 RepID=A0AAW1YN39_RUBAR